MKSMDELPANALPLLTEETVVLRRVYTWQGEEYESVRTWETPRRLNKQLEVDISPLHVIEHRAVFPLADPDNPEKVGALVPHNRSTLVITGEVRCPSDLSKMPEKLQTMLRFIQTVPHPDEEKGHG